MAGGIWVGMLLASIVYAVCTGSVAEVSAAAMDGTAQAVELAIGLAGTYMLWMGILEIAQRCGLAQKLAKGLSYPLAPLFREVPRNSEAMSAICMNISANVLGMGNAATPFGLRAMQALQKGRKSQTASNAMVMLIVLNSSSVQLLPTSIIALRYLAGSASPESITVEILIATTVTTIVGAVACKILEGKRA